MVLSDPQKRKEYDNGTYNPTEQTTDTTTNQKAYDIFNALFKDDIERFNKERKEYIQFLDEMEPEFNKYNRLLKNEKAAALNSSWSLLESLDSFDNKKARIQKRLSDLERNTQAFDDFLLFFEDAKKEIKQYDFHFNNIEQYTEPSQRGAITADFFSKLQSDIRKTLDTLARDVKEYDEHMQFLDEMEEELSKYNKTLKTTKEKLKGKRGQISANQIYEQQRNIRNELYELERRVEAFDDFSEFFFKTNQEIRTLYGKKLVNYDDYLDPKNRVAFAPKVLSDKQREISNIISRLSVERNEKINHLREEIKKRNLNFYAYLATRNTNEHTISMSDINTILKSMELIDQINEILTPYGITIEDFLKLKGKLLIYIEYKELLVIKDVINNYLNNVKAEDVNFADINFEDNDITETPSENPTR